MAVNVTYLIGAGASCGALPIVKNFTDSTGRERQGLGQSIQILAKQIEEMPVQLKNHKNYDEKLNLEIVKNLNELGKKSVKYSSPDTYIRSLWLQGNRQGEIEKAKKTLSFYLTVSQLRENEALLDDRYIPFLSSILENKSGIQFPDNIKLVTWNYDFQIELALQYFENKELNKIQGHFKIIPSEYQYEESPFVVHLNGIAGLMKNLSQNTSFFRRIESEDRYERLLEFFRVYKHLSLNYEIGDLLSFAWELSEANHERVKFAETAFSNAQILVIIGYSFPFFNREIDNKLIASFVEDKEPTDLKIYIQDPLVSDDQIEFLRQRFAIDYNIDIEAIKSVSQFFLPPEL